MIRQLKISEAENNNPILKLMNLPTWKIDKVAAPVGLILALIVFSILSSSFRRMDNLMLIAMDASLIGIVSVGQTLVLLIGGIDLSVGSVMALTGVTAATLMKGLSLFPELPSAVAICLGLVLGAAIGGLQGWLITNRGMPPFIVTLGTMFGLNGLTQAYTNSIGSPIYSLPDDFKWISDGKFGPIPVPALLMLAIYAVAWYVLRNTKFGRSCYSIGTNETAARLAGINVNRYKTCVYAISGLLAAVAGIILIASINGGMYTNGTGYELNSIAAVVVGGTSLSGGVGGVWGTLMGVLLMNTVNNGLTMCNVPPEWQQVVTGAVILLAVLVDIERRRRPKILAKREATPPAPVQMHLHQIIVKMTEVIEKRMGHLYCCLYLVNRGTNTLAAQTPFKTGRLPGDDSEGLHLVSANPSSLISIVRETGKPLWLEELGRASSGENSRIVPLHHSIQSAMGVPIYIEDRIVGVLEVQSTISDCFNSTAANLLSSLCNPMSEILEDAWLLESGWLVKQVRDNLRHLWDDLYLGRSELAEWVLSVTGDVSKYTVGARGEALREVLLHEIESLRPSEMRDQAKSARGYRILQLTYAEEHPVESIISELNISRRQYFYDLKESLECVSDALVREHQTKLQLKTSKEVAILQA